MPLQIHAVKQRALALNKFDQLKLMPQSLIVNISTLRGRTASKSRGDARQLFEDNASPMAMNRAMSTSDVMADTFDIDQEVHFFE